MSLRWWLFKHLNRVVARLRGSVGWCHLSYKINRDGWPDEIDEGGLWEGQPPQGHLTAWWNAFMFKYKLLVEE